MRVCVSVKNREGGKGRRRESREELVGPKRTEAALDVITYLCNFLCFFGFCFPSGKLIYLFSRNSVGQAISAGRLSTTD